MGDLTGRMLNERHRRVHIVSFHCYKVHGKAKLIFAVRSWGKGNFGKDEGCSDWKGALGQLQR